MKLFVIVYVIVQYNYPMFTVKFIDGLVNLIQQSM